MAQIAILERKCEKCGACAAACPFAAIDWTDGALPEINAGCRVCGICIKACPCDAIVRLETHVKGVDKSLYAGTLVVCEQHGGRLHPVSLELIGKAREMTGADVSAVIMGDGLDGCIETLRHYGLKKIYAYDDVALSFFRADAFCACVVDSVRTAMPSVVLTGATALGRSLAPRVATRLRTGLTADCTQLEMREDSDLVQIRPAFGGNIMAQIVTPYTRPQMATVRYKVMDAPARQDAVSGEVLRMAIPEEALASPVRHVRTQPVPRAASISDAALLVAAGRGLQRAADLDMIRDLAALLGGEWAVTRPLVEKGWADASRQIGLSGRTVRPGLIITCGVSGAIQFTASMDQSERIVAINADETAPIFGVAHIGIVADLYDVLPDLITRVKEGMAI